MTTAISSLEKNNTDRIIKAQLLSSKFFNLIILPTENCNFRCTYCYEDFAVGRMKKETILGIKALLEKRCSDLDYLHISWFGGEPLVAKDIVYEISEYATKLANQYPNLLYKANMTTNGYLLDNDTSTALTNAGVRQFQISLDGPREIHNESRIRANGKDTFDRIWANLLAIRNSSLPVFVTLRVHFTVDNVELLDPLIEDIRKEFIHDSRFSVFFKAIERLGGPNDDSIKKFSATNKEVAIRSLQAKLFGKNIQLPQNVSLGDGYICYASRPNSLVIRSNGDVGKCTVALYDERNKIATLQSDGTLNLIPGRLAPWIRGIKNLDPATLTCPLVGLPANNEAIPNSKEKILSK